MKGAFDGKYGVMKDFEQFVNVYGFDRLQFIAGCGFELRTTRVLELLADHSDGNIDCTIVDLLNKNDRSFSRARRLQRPNMTAFESITSAHKWPMKKVVADLYSQRFVAHRTLLNALSPILRKFSGDFLLDISSLPRSIAFPALRILWESKRTRNLFVAYTEDPSVGHLEKQAEKYRAPYFVPSFHPDPASSSFRIWLPVLGSDYGPIKKITNSYYFNDIYPIVGFPSSGPIETDEIIRRNQGIILGRSDKVIFASMNDPFQLAMKLNMLIDEIRRSLGASVRMIISPHGSKPQSVGAFMTAVAQGAAMLYCQPLSYRSLPGKVGQSHIYWLKGKAYSS